MTGPVQFASATSVITRPLAKSIAKSTSPSGIGRGLSRAGTEPFEKTTKQGLMRRLWNWFNVRPEGQKWYRFLPWVNNRNVSFVDINLPELFQHPLKAIEFAPRVNIGPASWDIRGGDIDARLFPNLLLDVTPEKAAAASEMAAGVGESVAGVASESGGLLSGAWEFVSGLFS